MNIYKRKNGVLTVNGQVLCLKNEMYEGADTGLKMAAAIFVNEFSHDIYNHLPIGYERFFDDLLDGLSGDFLLTTFDVFNWAVGCYSTIGRNEYSRILLESSAGLLCPEADFWAMQDELDNISDAELLSCIKAWGVLKLCERLSPCAAVGWILIIFPLPDNGS